MKLSIIIVNYNSKKIVKECLVSVFSNLKKSIYEVIVSDNGSTDGSIEMIKKEFAQTRLVENKKNIGFAAANNRAIEMSRGEYIFLLNPDTVILDESIFKLVEFMDDNKNIGAVGPLVVNADGSMQKQCKRGNPDFWNSFTYYSGLWKLFPRDKKWQKIFGGYFLLDKPNDLICEVGSLSGAAMIVRKSIIDKVGLMNEEYIMYWDDLDWCFRIKDVGWKIYYFPESKIIHYGGVGGSQIHAFKNLWYFYHGACVYYNHFFAQRDFFVVRFLYYAGVWTVFVLKIIVNFFRKEKIIGSQKPSSK